MPWWVTDDDVWAREREPPPLCGWCRRLHEPEYRFHAWEPRGCQDGPRQRCRWCGVLGVLDVHHIDDNHKNNDPENRVAICQVCHVAHHRAAALRVQRVKELLRYGVSDNPADKPRTPDGGPAKPLPRVPGSM